MKNIAILGSTGSIGQQALEVIENNPERFTIEVLTAYNNVDLLIEQAKKFHPNVVVIANEEKYSIVNKALADEGIKVYAGSTALAQVVEMGSVDLVLTAMVGYSGLIPTINAVKARKQIALANKETLVVAGDMINRLAIENKVDILPVDSEHSAIFQCLAGEYMNPVEKVILTCSGGPFHGMDEKKIAVVTSKEALKHPNWDMGAKITIDSATLMNKGFEVIEAKWLFGLKPDQIEVVVHPQSIIHSMVQFCDGSIKAQLGLPDMRLPIQYAFSFPERLCNDFPRLNFADFPSLTFSAPDTKNFRNLALAYEALQKGGNLACILNAANEIVVEAFLKGKISFPEIWIVNEQIMQKSTFINKPTLDDYMATDRESRTYASEMVSKLQLKN
ncbi:MAG: 1-deoxy-D-xylulose-5-phosphate reductoisomerase [Bacteroidia bacterium]|nr:1-deoxy-D-xylulose-5-phosphate reductoisomerase [Bacteroidia bacterium]